MPTERMADEMTPQQWREAANAVMEHATKWLAIAAEIEALTCGVVSNSGRYGEPLACGLPQGHSVPHAWASLPTFGSGGCIVEEI